MQTMSKNHQRYYTTKRLIRDFLSSTPKPKTYATLNGSGAGNPANCMVLVNQTVPRRASGERFLSCFSLQNFSIQAHRLLDPAPFLDDILYLTVLVAFVLTPTPREN